MPYTPLSELRPVNRLALWSEYPDKPRGKPLGCLRLGVCSNPGTEFKHALWLASVWAPRVYKSFDIVLFQPTTYGGTPIALFENLGYASFEVVYYNNKSGAFPAGDYPGWPYA